MHRVPARTFLLAACLAAPTFASAMDCVRPFQSSGLVTVPSGSMNGLASIDVPPRFWLKVEHITATIRLASAGEISDFNVTTHFDGNTAIHSLPVLPGFTAIDRKASDEVTLYASPRSQVQVSLVRGVATQATTGYYTLSGCLIPVR